MENPQRRDAKGREKNDHRHGTKNAEMIEKGKTLSADDAEGRRLKTAKGRGWTRIITTARRLDGRVKKR